MKPTFCIAEKLGLGHHNQIDLINIGWKWAKMARKMGEKSINLVCILLVFHPTSNPVLAHL
jgi:hypothetical protein